jgi:alkylhydroperoxidase family enzyme
VPAPPVAPRIAPGGRKEIGRLNWAVAVVLGRVTGGGPPRVFTTLGRNRGILIPWLLFARKLMPGGKLPRRESELVILRVAERCDSAYERYQHTAIGRHAGLTEAQLVAVASDIAAPCFSPREQTILRAVDELHDERQLSDATWAALSEFLPESQLIELCLLIGHYEMLAMTLNALRVQPEG